MANVFATTFVSPYRWMGTLTGDGTVAGPTVANATILAALPAGPLRDAFNAEYASQALMRTALLNMGAGVRCTIQLVVTIADVTAQVNQVVADVDTDAVTATKAEINYGMTDSTGATLAIVTWEWIPPRNR